MQSRVAAICCCGNAHVGMALHAAVCRAVQRAVFCVFFSFPKQHSPSAQWESNESLEIEMDANRRNK